MANIKLVADSMFRDKYKWNDVPLKEKEETFFIFNRYFSKKYPEKAQLLNLKNIDKASAMNLWYSFMKNKPYPSWFWSKSKKRKEKEKITENDKLLLLEYTRESEFNIDYLLKNYFDLIKEELKHIKALEKL